MDTVNNGFKETRGRKCKYDLSALTSKKGVVKLIGVTTANAISIAKNFAKKNGKLGVWQFRVMSDADGVVIGRK